MKSAPEVKPDRTSLGTFDSFLGSSARGLRMDSAWADPFEGVAGGSDQAPSDQQPDHYLRDEPMEDAESAQPPQVYSRFFPPVKEGSTCRFHGVLPRPACF